MRVKTTFASMQSALNIVSSILTDSLLQDELKNIIFWVRDGKVYVTAYNVFIISCTELEAELFDFDGSEYLVQISGKALVDILGTFSSLSKTSVSSLEFDFQKDGAMLYVEESPKEDEDIINSRYSQTSKFRMNIVRLQEYVKTEITNVEFKDGGLDISDVDTPVRSLFLLYLKTLLPTIASRAIAGDSVATRIVFKKDFVYTFPQQYVVMMPNKLDLHGFVLSGNTAKYLMNFAEIEDFQIVVEERDDVVRLSLKNSNTLAVVNTMNTEKAFNIKAYTNRNHNNAIAVNRAYFLDVLKRFAVGKDVVSVVINIDEEEMRIYTKTASQKIPIVNKKGNGEYSFNISPELLGDVVLSHAGFVDATDLHFCVEKTGEASKEAITLSVMDSMGYCTSVMSGLRKANDSAWF